jgi:hypothetical protein
VRGTAKRSRMTSLQASRTLVKSPPELWAELSELESLARHLGEFGEIRITQVDPESRVEWEADRASGTVRLEPSGWGTRVVLTVDTPEAPPEAALPEPAPDAVEPEPEPQPEPEPVAVEPEPEPAPEPVAVEPAPARRRRVKRGWFARLFRRTPPPPPAPVESPAPAVEAEAPVTPDEPVAETPEPTPAERAFGTIEWETPEAPVEEEPEPAPLRPDEAHALLTDVLDTLGAAHHRPYSRP